MLYEVITGLWENRRNPIPCESFSSKDTVAALRESIWEIPLPFVVLGGIYGGFFAITEAAAVTAMYVMVVEVFIYKEINRITSYNVCYPKLLRLDFARSFSLYGTAR